MSSEEDPAPISVKERLKAFQEPAGLSVVPNRKASHDSLRRKEVLGQSTLSVSPVSSRPSSPGRVSPRIQSPSGLSRTLPVKPELSSQILANKPSIGNLPALNVHPASPSPPLAYQPRIKPPAKLPPTRSDTGSSTLTFPPAMSSSTLTARKKAPPVLPPRKAYSLQSTPSSSPLTSKPVLPPRPTPKTNGSPLHTPPMSYAPSFTSSQACGCDYTIYSQQQHISELEQLDNEQGHFVKDIHRSE